MPACATDERSRTGRPAERVGCRQYLRLRRRGRLAHWQGSRRRDARTGMRCPRFARFAEHFQANSLRLRFATFSKIGASTAKLAPLRLCLANVFDAVGGDTDKRFSIAVAQPACRGLRSAAGKPAGRCTPSAPTAIAMSERLLMSSLVVAEFSRTTLTASRASCSSSSGRQVFLAQLDEVHSSACGSRRCGAIKRRAARTRLRRSPCGR